MSKTLTDEQLADAREYDKRMKAVASANYNIAHVFTEFPVTKEMSYSQLSVYRTTTKALLEAIERALEVVDVDEEWIEATKDL